MHPKCARQCFPFSGEGRKRMLPRGASSIRGVFLVLARHERRSRCCGVDRSQKTNGFDTRVYGSAFGERAESEMRPPHQLRLAISAIADEPISGKNATENVANAVALLTSAIVKKTISTIADDDDRFVAGIFVFVFSDYFTLVLPGNFEEASTLALMKVLGIEEFHRSFDTIKESYNELVESRPKILEGIGKACEAWFKNPGASKFQTLVELFKNA